MAATDFDVPLDILEWLSGIFHQCNERVTEKLCNNPNMQEGWLDHSWIDEVSRFSTPMTLDSGWTARMQVHYLGGLRHWGSWEIADIGALLFVRSPTRIERSKVILLQSKRLYPTNMAVVEDTLTDYRIGFARLADPEDLAQPLSALEADYEFTEESRYGALDTRSEQVKAIDQHQEEHGIPVYYHFYNPWRLPFSQHVPIVSYVTPDGPLELGVRVVPAKTVHRALAKKSVGYHPTIKEIAASGAPDTYGWRLEAFMADEFLSCREGALFQSISEPSIDALFNRRSGPIAAAIAITIDAPPGVLD